MCVNVSVEQTRMKGEPRYTCDEREESQDSRGMDKRGELIGLAKNDDHGLLISTLVWWLVHVRMIIKGLCCCCLAS